MDSITSLRTVLAAAAFGLGGIVVGGVAPMTATASAPGTCAQPSFAATVDPAGSSPMSPRVEIFWDGLTTPAQQHVERGDGEYEDAAINRGHVATTAIVSRPTYEQPGTYHLTATVADGCAATGSGFLDLTVPMALPEITPTVVCPGTLDESGYCIVPPGDVSLNVADPAGGTVWTWSIFPDGAAGAGSSDGTPSTHIDAGSVLLAQAAAPSTAGWLVTSPLRIVAAVAQPPRIVELIAPRHVEGGMSVAVGFTVPVGGEMAAPSIVIDGQAPIHESSTEVRFAPGSHTVTFALRFADGAVVTRQAIIVASAPLSWLPAAAAGLAAVIAVLLLLLFLALRRRRHHIKEFPQ